MSLARITSIAVAALALALAGCKVDTINNFPTKPAPVRFINFVPDAASLDVKKDGAVVFAAVPFATATNYQNFDNKQTEFDIFAPNVPNAIANASTSLSANQSYTLVGFGVVDTGTAEFQPDSFVETTSGNSQFRAMHAAYSAGALDFYLTKPGVDITNASPLFQLGFNGSTSFSLVNADRYQIRLIRSNSGLLAYDSGSIPFADKATDSYYIYVKDGTHAVNVLKLSMADGSSVVEVPNTLAAAKVVNAAYQAGAVDQKWDGIVAVNNLMYPAATATYYTLPVGSRIITFESHAAPGASIATTTQTFAASTDSTILLSGPNGSEVITVLPDHDISPPSGTARVRVVNASADVPAFDLVVDGEVKATNIAYTQASAYFDTSNSNHKVEFRVPGTTTSLLTIDSQQFGGAQVSSLYLIGPGSALAKLLTVDND